jgi:hypothetical protein
MMPDAPCTMHDAAFGLLVLLVFFLSKALVAAAADTQLNNNPRPTGTSTRRWLAARHSISPAGKLAC